MQEKQDRKGGFVKVSILFFFKSYEWKQNNKNPKNSFPYPFLGFPSNPIRSKVNENVTSNGNSNWVSEKWHIWLKCLPCHLFWQWHLVQL